MHATAPAGPSGFSDTQYKAPSIGKTTQPPVELTPRPTLHARVDGLFDLTPTETNGLQAALTKKVSVVEKTSDPESFDKNPVIKDLVKFLKRSPTAWQAVDQISSRLGDAGFVHLDENEIWDLKNGGKYFATRNGSSLVAFVLPTDKPVSATILGAHTDSPGLKLKPNPDLKSENYNLLSTQIYGGPILPSWFNRPLGIAGQCHYADVNGEVKYLSVDIRKPIATIPQLAIHLNRDLKTKIDLNPEKELNAMVSIDSDGKTPFVDALIEKEYDVKPLPGFELFLVPVEEPILWGPNKQMISSPRLDNLLGCHASLVALLNSGEPSSQGAVKMMALWDNEEVGSNTAQGAASPFLDNILSRITTKFGLDAEGHQVFVYRSYLISNDVAHAVHPNFPEKHAPNHKPLFGRGVVIKNNANQCYATNSTSQAKMHQLFVKNGIACNQFAVRSDSTCGSTIGPITSTGLGINTVDIGEPVLSMHSIVEVGNCRDHLTMCAGLETVLKGT